MKVEEDTPHVLEEGKKLGGEIGIDELIKALEKFKVNMPIKEMVEKNTLLYEILARDPEAGE